MMDKETFANVVTRLKKSAEAVRALKVLGVDTIEFTEDFHIIIRELLSQCFNPEQLGWIDWYLWERESLAQKGKFNKAYKKVGRKRVEICHTIDSLYETVLESSGTAGRDP